MVHKKADITGRKDNRGIPYEVIPFKDIKEIEKIKQYLQGKKDKRNYCLFTVGINAGLRAGDLVTLRVGEVIDAKGKVKNKVLVLENKTDKPREFELNRTAKKAIEVYLSTKKYELDDWLFPSRKGTDHIQVEAIRKMIKGFCEDLNIKGNYGTHSMRKTFGYHSYMKNITQNPLILPTLQKIFNHSSPAITMLYIGITSDEISNVYQSLNL